MNNGQLIAAWNNNEPVTVIEMGGLGPDYEQAIYILAFAFLNELLTQPQPIDFKLADKTVCDIEKLPAIGALITKVGPSGAMIGAAWNVAFVFMRHGYEKGLAMAPDRHITVQKNTPRNYE